MFLKSNIIQNLEQSDKQSVYAMLMVKTHAMDNIMYENWIQEVLLGGKSDVNWTVFLINYFSRHNYEANDDIFAAISDVHNHNNAWTKLIFVGYARYIEECIINDVMPTDLTSYLLQYLQWFLEEYQYDYLICDSLKMMLATYFKNYDPSHVEKKHCFFRKVDRILNVKHNTIEQLYMI